MLNPQTEQIFWIFYRYPKEQVRSFWLRLWLVAVANNRTCVGVDWHLTDWKVQLTNDVSLYCKVVHFATVLQH